MLLNLVPDQFKIAAICVLIMASFMSGFVVRGWQADSVALAAQKAAQISIEASAKRQAEIASGVENAIAAIRVTERVIDRGIIREIQNNETVYRNECITDAGRLLVNAAAAGKPVSSQPTAQVR